MRVVYIPLPPPHVIRCVVSLSKDRNHFTLESGAITRKSLRKQFFLPYDETVGKVASIILPSTFHYLWNVEPTFPLLLNMIEVSTTRIFADLYRTKPSA